MSSLTTSFPRFTALPMFYINMDARPDRKAIMEQQLPEKLQRWQAFDAKQALEEDFEQYFDLAKSRQRYGLALRPGQMACTISHFQLYQHIAQDQTIAAQDWVLIAEDDIVFIPQFRARLEATLDTISQARFEDLELVILRIGMFSEFVDFTPEIQSYQPNTQTVSFANEFRKQLVNPDLFKISVQALNPQYQYYTFEIPESYLKYSRNCEATSNANTVNVNATANVDTDVTATVAMNLAPVAPLTSKDHAPQDLQHYAYLLNQATLIFPNRMIPCSSGCYLIRKSTINRIVEIYSKPWWITDDFKAIVPLVHTAILSPNLVKDYEAVSDSSDVGSFNPEAIEQSHSTIIFTRTHRKQMRFLRRFPRVCYAWGYSEQPVYRNLARSIKRIFNLTKLS